MISLSARGSACVQCKAGRDVPGHEWRRVRCCASKLWDSTLGLAVIAMRDVGLLRRLGIIAIGFATLAVTAVQPATSHASSQADSVSGSKPVLSDPEGDPYERMNRIVFNFNNWVDAKLLRPVAVRYRESVPQGVRQCVGNFFSNLDYPLVALNQFLQGKPKLGFQDMARFGVNSVFGIGGLFDVATDMGLIEHQEDFGQTLSVWGMPEGPYAVAPFIGPGASLDFVNTATVIFLDASNLVSDPRIGYSMRGAEVISQRAAFLGFEQLQFGDPYIFQRETYLQRRAFLVSDGAPIEDDDFLIEDDFFFD